MGSCHWSPAYLKTNCVGANGGVCCDHRADISGGGVGQRVWCALGTHELADGRLVIGRSGWSCHLASLQTNRNCARCHHVGTRSSGDLWGETLNRPVPGR